MMAERMDGEPSQPLHSESEAEAGAATVAQSANRNGSTGHTDFERAANGSEKTAIETPNLSRAASAEVVAEPKTEAPTTDEPQRSKGRTALLMCALAVSHALLAM